MPPRVTLAWNRCSLCGRHAPTWRCRVGRRYVEVCLFCAYTLGLECEGLTVALGRSPRSAVLEPDEGLLEALGAGKSQTRPTPRRRVSGRRGRRPSQH